jgi:hypothetical protein
VKKQEEANVGVRYAARVAHEKKIAKIKAELEPIESGIVNARVEEGSLDREIAKLAVKAVHGDRDALRKQRELHDRKKEHELQASNLETQAVPIRRALAAAEAETQYFLLAEMHERAVESIGELPSMVAELSKVVKPIARAFGEFRSRINAATAEALPLIARGNPERIRGLENRLRTMILRGIRAQLSFEFRSEGLDIIDTSQFDGRDFGCVVEPEIRRLMAALEVDLHANGVPTPGRATFRCLTNIAGLFGLHLAVGELASLPLEDENVRKMIASGALEMIEAPPAHTEVRE